MNIFTQIKERLTARQVAEGYGLKVNRNGMACCPFHEDHHPSMKIDTNYYCFSCGAKGDAVGYVAQMYGLPQYEAAKKVNEDFQLGIENGNPKEYRRNPEVVRKMKEREQILLIQTRFERWCNKSITALKACMHLIVQVHAVTIGKTPDEIFLCEDYAVIAHGEPRIHYWLDIFCLSKLEERKRMFMQNRGEVERIAKKVTTAGNRILERSRKSAGYGNEYCG